MRQLKTGVAAVERSEPQHSRASETKMLLTSRTTIASGLLALGLVVCSEPVFAAVIFTDDGQSPLGAGDFAFELPWQGITRRYDIHVPPHENQSLPVMLVLHGGGGRPSGVQESTDMDALADREGFVVVYPAGTNPDGDSPRLYWNDGRPTVDPLWGQTDDVGFIAEVLDDLSARVTVDSSRVYATGISNGGSMVLRLAAELADRITAVAPVATSRRLDEFTVSADTKVPLIQFHGRLDTFVPFNGGVRREEVENDKFLPYEGPPVEDAFAGWAERNESEGLPVTVEIGQATNRRYGATADGVPSELWILNDGGHTWPGRTTALTPFEIQLGVGPIHRDISATQVMWEFFERLHAPQLGDLNVNGLLDVRDIDLLSEQVRSASTIGRFDLTGDDTVDQLDRLTWISAIKRSFVGDANLDGQFNSSDLVEVFSAAQYEDQALGNSSWATGDWDGDGDFTTGDLVAAFVDGHYEQGPRLSNGVAVPEPPTSLLLAAALAAYLATRCG